MSESRAAYPVRPTVKRGVTAFEFCSDPKIVHFTSNTDFVVYGARIWPRSGSYSYCVRVCFVNAGGRIRRRGGRCEGRGTSSSRIAIIGVDNL